MLRDNLGAVFWPPCLCFGGHSSAPAHTLSGDYHQALRVLENVELNKKGLYSRVPKCQITIYYYVGFCYMMMRRYQV